ncbi:uncharacterized protein LOC129989009 [Argiope bruennichi]|uniref:uncharacterized protein LOC129989009 n=1 Tax=Argiope bruennichi TaxID=94029 RepID=UPI002493DAA9|nr:uncharacterized protein LOC129989009 [Argiope bruennichi]
MEAWRSVIVLAVLAVALTAAQMNMFCDLSRTQLEKFMDCGKDGFSAEASSGWSTCKEEILGYSDSNGTDSQAIVYMCEHNKTRIVEDCMKKSGKKVNRKARAKMMVCMMKILT